MKIIIYVLYHNEETKLQSMDIAKDHTCAIPLELPQTHLLENVMYDCVLNSLIREWENADYVGTISPFGATNKVRNFKMLCKALDKMQSIDLNRSNLGDITFFLPGSGPGWIKHQNTCAQELFECCIKTLKLTIIPNNVKWGFCNFWIAKTCIMKDYINFFNVFWLPTLEADERVWENSNYKSHAKNKAIVLGIMKRPYFPMHTFLCERFINVYVYSKNLKKVLWNGFTFCLN
jgi:hypothetical protein